MEALVGAFVLAFVLCVLSGGAIIKLLRKLKAGQVISEDVPTRHLQKQGTPTMGGVIILAALSIAALAFGGATAFPLVLVTLAYGGIGFLDDFLITKRGKSLGLKARQKLALQFLAAAGAALWLYKSGQATTIFYPWAVSSTNHIPSAMLGGFDAGIWYYPLVVLLIVGFSNAVNLTDGLDGLASGTMVAAIGPMALVAMAWRMQGASPFCAAVAGACLGFLVFNFFPAKVFMGDTGSLALGAALAIAAIYSKMELLLVVFGFIFAAEALSVMLQVSYFKLTHGKRIFRMSPLHHHFELAGWEEPQVVVRFWIIQGVLSAIGLWLSTVMLG